MTRSRGYTLLELLIVMTLMGLAVAVTAVKLHGAYERVAIDHWLRRIQDLDSFARQHALRHRSPVRLTISERDRKLTLTDEEGEVIPSLTCPIPRGLAIDEVRIGESSQTSDPSVITYSSIGTSPTYAIRFLENTERHYWLLFTGQTGQATLLENDRHAQRILALLKTGRDTR
jgi:prepilin-type N-terminal cleavage/methylation domain-containing protein